MILDFGSKAGSNLKEPKFEAYGDTISVDIRMNHLRRASGMRVLADITKPIVREKSVDCVTMIHVLEHLYLPDVTKTIRQALEVARDYIYIRGPWFDADDYLRERGFDLFWSTWPGHVTHLTTSQLADILYNLNVENFTIVGHGPPILNSASHRVHPTGYEAGGNYHDGKYPPKEFVEFDIPIWNELLCEILL